MTESEGKKFSFIKFIYSNIRFYSHKTLFELIVFKVVTLNLIKLNKRREKCLKDYLKLLR